MWTLFLLIATNAMWAWFVWKQLDSLQKQTKRLKQLYHQLESLRDFYERQTQDVAKPIYAMQPQREEKIKNKKKEYIRHPKNNKHWGM